MGPTVRWRWSPTIEPPHEVLTKTLSWVVTPIWCAIPYSSMRPGTARDCQGRLGRLGEAGTPKKMQLNGNLPIN